MNNCGKVPIDAWGRIRHTVRSRGVASAAAITVRISLTALISAVVVSAIVPVAAVVMAPVIGVATVVTTVSIVAVAVIAVACGNDHTASERGGRIEEMRMYFMSDPPSKINSMKVRLSVIKRRAARALTSQGEFEHSPVRFVCTKSHIDG